ncbi:MAG TPA: squalene/phytoene synthase family protein, partial [Pseudonocardia sp.]
MAERASRELDAAGVTDPVLRAAYTRSRGLHARYGRTYFLATRLLAPAQRPSVHALYGFARYADEIVDDPRADPDGRPGPAQQAAALGRLRERLRGALAGPPRPGPAGSDPAGTGTTGNHTSGDDGADPVLIAVADTASRYRLGADLFDDFLASMQMDTHVTDYPSFEALGRYMHGSAGVIGLQMLPVLGTV